MPRSVSLAWLLSTLLAAPAFAQEQSATEINKQLTNPVSELWSIQFQQNNYRVDPGKGEDNRWSTDLLFQPVLPLAIDPDWNLPKLIRGNLVDPSHPEFGLPK